jgi:hypothetical protein
MIMNVEEYLKQRLDRRIRWYEEHSDRNRILHTITKSVEIVCAAIIPLLAGYAKEGSAIFSIAIGVLGALVAISAGISTLLKFQEKWISYRTTVESLHTEKYLFLAGVAPYDVASPFELLVRRVETITLQENAQWAAFMANTGKDTPPSRPSASSTPTPP